MRPGRYYSWGGTLTPQKKLVERAGHDKSRLNYPRQIRGSVCNRDHLEIQRSYAALELIGKARQWRTHWLPILAQRFWLKICQLLKSCDLTVVRVHVPPRVLLLHQPLMSEFFSKFHSESLLSNVMWDHLGTAFDLHCHWTYPWSLSKKEKVGTAQTSEWKAWRYRVFECSKQTFGRSITFKNSWQFASIWTWPRSTRVNGRSSCWKGKNGVIRRWHLFGGHRCAQHRKNRFNEIRTEKLIPKNKRWSIR